VSLDRSVTLDFGLLTFFERSPKRRPSSVIYYIDIIDASFRRDFCRFIIVVATLIAFVELVTFVASNEQRAFD